MTAAYQPRRLLALACVAGACACATASCALLVSYEGYRNDGDGGVDGSEAASDAPMAELDSGGEAASDAASDGANGCRGAVPGVYCGRALPNYTGSVQDLVHCLGDGTMGAVMPCSDGCATMPDGRQDVCNPCRGRADAPYCLQEVVPPYPANDVLIMCSGAVVAGASLCPKGCVSSACL